MCQFVRVIVIVLGLAVVAGCTTLAEPRQAGLPPTAASSIIQVCHGYGCAFRTRLDLTQHDNERFRSIFRRAGRSPEAERRAISAAVQYFEERAGQATGVRDKPKGPMTEAGVRGQMDCIDESTNTRALLLYLQRHGLLKHHTVQAPRTRGFLADGRYPHTTAVIRAGDGRLWAVDSWYEAMGGPPDIMPLDAWMRRGVLGER